MTDRTTAQQIQALRTWARGYSADRAAVELLITHDEWLNRPDFRDRFVEDIPVDEVHTEPLTVIHWDLVLIAVQNHDLVASSSALAVLRIALSLAVCEPVDLCEALVGLDATNTAAVATAVVTAAQADDRVSVTLVARGLPDWLREEKR
ncbi:hypothetical protein ACFXKD_13680 [Nocardiopsis aegyptia]|uniref:hypothetical protein n=1 Tax=Nocardiopsis aegyptia TaxID=220378 RepID=UPI003671AECE